MHSAEALRFRHFNGGKPLESALENHRGPQLEYVRNYLADLGAVSVIEEPSYFDRDYLAEFAAFYSTSARGYTNVCRRLHFFSEHVDREVFQRHLTHAKAPAALQASYLGFCVVRPLSPPLFGRTVLRWYPDHPAQGQGPRETTTARNYKVHLAGLSLCVHGLAWQQQDQGVGACATVALSSALHGSTLSESSPPPTTVEITRAAHKSGTRGRRVFPSIGFEIEQLCEAIQHFGLSPILVEHDLPAPQVHGAQVYDGFSRARFSSSHASFLRSGYPVVMAGSIVGGGPHAVCVTGFRSSPFSGSNGDERFDDLHAPYLYLHDDNIGPNVRFAVRADKPQLGGGNPIVYLKLDPPPSSRARRHPSSGEALGPKSLIFVPNAFVVAVNDQLRMTPLVLNNFGLDLADTFQSLVAALDLGFEDAVSVSSRFIGVREYLSEELPRYLGEDQPEALGYARLRLTEGVRPMCLHLGLVRVSLCGQPFMDVLCDTTEAGSKIRCFAHLMYDADLAAFWAKRRTKISQALNVHFGEQIDVTMHRGQSSG